MERISPTSIALLDVSVPQVTFADEGDFEAFGRDLTGLMPNFIADQVSADTGLQVTLAVMDIRRGGLFLSIAVGIVAVGQFAGAINDITTLLRR